MARDLPVEIIRAMTAQETGVIVLSLLELSHPEIDTLRLVNNTQAVTSQGDEFLPYPFSVVLPEDEADTFPLLQVTVQNVSLDVVRTARAVAGKQNRAVGTVSLVSFDDPDTRFLTFEQLDVVNVQYAADVLTFDLTSESYLSEPYPGDLFTPSKFPGLF